jgi:hypothetical protein
LRIYEDKHALLEAISKMSFVVRLRRIKTNPPEAGKNPIFEMASES